MKVSIPRDLARIVAKTSLSDICGGTEAAIVYLVRKGLIEHVEARMDDKWASTMKILRSTAGTEGR